jgi:hypothetical protein
MKKGDRNMTVSLINGLSSKQMEDLNEFLGSRMDSPQLIQVIQDFAEETGTLYRGIMYRKSNLEKGHVYEHGYVLSSWSIEEAIGIGFSCNDYIPEGAVEDLYEETFGEWKECNEIDDATYTNLEEKFCRILLVDKKGKGFNVNKYHADHPFIKEQEVIVYNGKWQFTDIEECVSDDSKTYYKVTVERIED